MKLFLDASMLLAAAGSPIGASRAIFSVLLTLDKADFIDILGGRFYGLDVLLPYDLLQRERAAGRLPGISD